MRAKINEVEIKISAREAQEILNVLNQSDAVSGFKEVDYPVKAAQDLQKMLSSIFVSSVTGIHTVN